MMNVAKKLAAGVLALLLLVPVLTACSAEDDFPSDPEFDNAPLPASFNLYDEGCMTPAKSQGGTGLCWAFGALSTVESAILTAGLAEPDELDLSEGAVAYYMYPLPGEFENGGTGDGLCIRQGKPKANFYMACSFGGDPPDADFPESFLDELEKEYGFCVTAEPVGALLEDGF